MTSNIQDGFEVIASSEYNNTDNAKFHAFNDNPEYGYGWLSKFNEQHTFIGIKLPTPKIANIVTFTSCGSYWESEPEKFRIEASNDGNSFITLSIQSTPFDGPNQRRTFRFDNTQPFSCYRIVVAKDLGFKYTRCKHLNFGFSSQ